MLLSAKLLHVDMVNVASGPGQVAVILVIGALDLAKLPADLRKQANVPAALCCEHFFTAKAQKRKLLLSLFRTTGADAAIMPSVPSWITVLYIVVDG